MTKRALCFLSVLLLALLPAFASADCTHHNDDGVPYPLFPQGYIPPQVGVPGYTGDQCCTNCGAIVIRGSEIPALDPQQEEEANKREDPVPVPAAEQPVVEQPVVEQPVVAQPVVEQPVIPQEQPQAPSQPAQPEAPVQPAQNTQPETQAQPAQQAPVQPPETKQESQPAAKPDESFPAPPPETVSQPQAQQQAPSGQSAPAAGGSGRSAKTARQPFSALYPYRRVKLAPQPEILAEFAGVLLWPVAGTPFLNLFGD